MKKFLIGILSICCLFLVGCGKTETEEEKNLGSVEKTTVEVLVKFFNDEINENSGLAPINDDTPELEEGVYRYDLEEEGVYLTVTPEKQEVKDKDIVESMQICFSKADDNVAEAYAKLLVVANNPEITSEEANDLVIEAKDKKNESINNGKGISVKYVENNDHYEYQVIRNNK